MGISRKNAYMLPFMAMMMAGEDMYPSPEEPKRTTPRPRPFGQPLPTGIKVFEVQIETKEDMKCKFLVASINQKNADKKFDRLFIDLKKLAEEKGNSILEDDITKIKRKYFKYADYDHIL